MKTEAKAIDAALHAFNSAEPDFRTKMRAAIAAYDAARGGRPEHDHEWDTERESDVTYTPPPEFDKPKVIRCYLPPRPDTRGGG